ncbi:MAG: peptidylprolyl isomerase [Gemmatimonadaceae bacterium]|nr:peptidylprolyl isomerase [Gemmatimonadaceae bacterium]
MPRHPTRFRLVALCLAAAACSGGDPATGTTDVAAVAGGQSLSATDLGTLFGQSRLTLRTEDVRSAAELWVDYQLLARAAAGRDTIDDPTLVEAALWGPVANARARQWYQVVSLGWPADTSSPKALYDSGQVLAASQILLDVPQVALPLQRAKIRAAVDSLRSTLTPANFARVASRISADSASRRQGGRLPAWPAGRDIMVPEFEAGVLATKPGGISGVIVTSFGVHLVYRPTWAEAQSRVVPVARQLARLRAESTYFAALETAHGVTLVPDVAPLTRAVVRDPGIYADSATPLATVARGESFTAATLVRWLRAYPPAEGMPGRLANASDTLLPQVLRRIIRNELFLRQADSARIRLTPAEMTAFSGELRTQIESAVGTLGLAGRTIPDSVWALDVGARRAIFAARVQAQHAGMVRGTAATVPISLSLRQLLRSRYPDASISPAGLDRALEIGRRVRQSADSARNAADSGKQPDSAGARDTTKVPRRPALKK